MKQLISSLFLLVLSSSPFADPNPSTTLHTTALGYPYTAPFKVEVLFSEPVTGFDATVVNLVNATITTVTGSNASYVMTITPTIPGPITIFIPANVVKSLTTGAPNKTSNKLNITALDPILNPSSNFNLLAWTLTLPLPLGEQGNAISIDTPILNGYPILNTGYSNPPYFFTDTVTGSMNFFAPLNGATTTNSFFPKSELSEKLLNSTSPSWRLATFESNSMTASLLVTQVPPSKRIIIGALRDKGNSDASGVLVAKKALVKLFYDLNQLDPNGNPCNGCVYAQIRPVPIQDIYLKTVVLANNTPLNKLFIYRITVLRDGTLTVKVNNKSTSFNLNTSLDNTVGWGTQELLFKAGVYVPDTGTSNVLGGAVNFYSLQVKHSGCPQNSLRKVLEHSVT